MSVRRSSRLASQTPTRVATQPPITNFGSVKRRHNDTNDDPKPPKSPKLVTPQRVAFLDTLQSGIVNFDPIPGNSDLNVSLKNDSNGKKTPEPSTPVSRRPRPLRRPLRLSDDDESPAEVQPLAAGSTEAQTTPVKNAETPSTSVCPETPKSARRRLIPPGSAKEADDERLDLLFSTFSSKRPIASRSGLGFVERTPKNGKTSLLAQKVKDAAEYALPEKFSLLITIFENMERIMALLKCRGQRVTFDDLKQRVEAQCKKTFSRCVFGKILALYPSSYTLRIENHRPLFGMGMRTPGRKHDLVVEPNLRGDIQDYWHPKSPTKSSGPLFGSPTKLISPQKKAPVCDFIPASPRKAASPAKATPLPRELRLDFSEKLDAWRMICRASIFRYKLVCEILHCHDVFLAKMKVDKADIPFGKYHPKFNLESVPDVIPIQLPRPPKDPAQMTITGFLTPGSSALPGAIENTITQLKSPEKPTHTPNGKVPLSPSKFAGDTPKLSLYERILEKQRKAEALRAPEILARKKRHGHLEFIDSKLFVAVWFEFQRIKESTIPLQNLVYRLCKSFGFGGEECKEHLELLSEVAGRYFDIYAVGVHSVRYVRLHKSGDINRDFAEIKQCIRDELAKCPAD